MTKCYYEIIIHQYLSDRNSYQKNDSKRDKLVMKNIFEMTEKENLFVNKERKPISNKHFSLEEQFLWIVEGS